MPATVEVIFETDDSEGKTHSLGLDSEGHLYWDNRPVVVERGIALTTWQKIGAVVGVASGAIVALVVSARFALECL
jgi:hypothetical protein